MAGSKLSWPQIEGAPLSGGVTSIQQKSAYNFALYSRHAGSRSSLPAARATAGPSGGNPMSPSKPQFQLELLSVPSRLP